MSSSARSSSPTFVSSWQTGAISGRHGTALARSFTSTIGFTQHLKGRSTASIRLSMMTAKRSLFHALRILQHLSGKRIPISSLCEASQMRPSTSYFVLFLRAGPIRRECRSTLLTHMYQQQRGTRLPLIRMCSTTPAKSNCNGQQVTLSLRLWHNRFGICGMSYLRRRAGKAIFFRRRHQPRRPPLAKIRPGNPAPAMGAGTLTGTK
jgi:hypothetical protein